MCYEAQLKPYFFFLQDHGDSSGKSLLILTEFPAEGRIRPLRLIRGELAQWLEQRNHNPLVPSSNLGFATKNILRNNGHAMWMWSIRGNLSIDSFIRFTVYKATDRLLYEQNLLYAKTVTEAMLAARMGWPRQPSRRVALPVMSVSRMPRLRPRRA